MVNVGNQVELVGDSSQAQATTQRQQRRCTRCKKPMKGHKKADCRRNK